MDHGPTRIMDLGWFESRLFVHKDTLKHLCLSGVRGNADGSLFNASHFPVLELLKLSKWPRRPPMASYDDRHSLILGPKLHIFCWEFTLNNVGIGSFGDFGNDDCLWLENFAKAAAALKAPIKRIIICFQLNVRQHDLGTRDVNSVEYPWDKLDTVRDEILRPRGIDLTHMTRC
jgi:hypothetical protein